MRRFTLVELMIVVAIMMVLAAIAIPQLNAMQLRAKRAELPTNVDGVGTALLAYEAAHDLWMTGAWSPNVAPGKTAVTWPGGAGYAAVGWSPDGKVRGVYTMGALGTECTCPGVAPTTCLSGGAAAAVSAAWSDVDGNGSQACYAWVYDIASKSGVAAFYTGSTIY